MPKEEQRRTKSAKRKPHFVLLLIALAVIFIATATSLSFIFPDPTPLQSGTIDNLWNVVWMFSSFAIGWMVGKAASGEKQGISTD